MEKLPSFVVNGGIKLPIGYRFCPTDEELVIHYLKRKVLSHPLPASVIPDFDVFRTHPSSLPGVGDSKEKRYFFSRRNGTVAREMWMLVVAKHSHLTKTHWVMHELSLQTPSHPLFQMVVADWAVYRIFQRRKLKRKGCNGKLSNRKKVERLEEETKPNFIDFTVEYGSDTIGPPPPPSSPSCSEGSDQMASF
ncbi:NAC domain-containing protein 83-like [Senna tora]|uniref:NAC domain-containing protein 83-like n=1 Tax=Senna tora TaxID=362788 RepID=A0A834TKU9_9FABA|nr:NAC domain-containing protein 83-like [Senna tora]